jgi:hypothetical protein
MNRNILPLVLGALFLQAFAAVAQEHGRIKKTPPTPAEEGRIASEMVMSDGTLHVGDIVSTDRGFFQYRGVAADGVTGNFVPVLNPLSRVKDRC